MLWLRDLCIFCLMFTVSWGMDSSPCRILWSMVSLCPIPREASSFQPSSLRMPDTLTIPCAPCADLAPCLWTLSSLSMSRLRTGSQLAPQYSIGANPDVTKLTCFFRSSVRIKFVSVFVWYLAARGACLRYSCVSEHWFADKGPHILVCVVNWKFLRREQWTSTDAGRRHASCHWMIGLPPLEMGPSPVSADTTYRYCVCVLI